jgi:hypothetical protein
MSSVPAEGPAEQPVEFGPTGQPRADSVAQRLRELEKREKRRRVGAQLLIGLLLLMLVADSVATFADWIRGTGRVFAGSISTQEVRVQVPESDMDCLIGFDAGRPRIMFRRANTELLTLGLDARTDPFVRWADHDGHERMRAAVVTMKKDAGTRQGAVDEVESHLRIKNSNGTVAIEVGVSSADLPFVRLNDQRGKPTAVIELGADGNPVVELMNSARTRLVKLQTKPGESAILVKDEKGRNYSFP